MSTTVMPRERLRLLAALLAALALAGGAAGCGSSGGSGESAGGGESEAAPGAAPGAESEEATVPKSVGGPAALQREEAELATIRRRREQAERAIAASAASKAVRKSKLSRHRAKVRGSAKVRKHHRQAKPPKAKGNETTAQQEARKRFEAEEAREAAEFKKK